MTYLPSMTTYGLTALRQDKDAMRWIRENIDNIVLTDEQKRILLEEEDEMSSSEVVKVAVFSPDISEQIIHGSKSFDRDKVFISSVGRIFFRCHPESAEVSYILRLVEPGLPVEGMIDHSIRDYHGFEFIGWCEFDDGAVVACYLK